MASALDRKRSDGRDLILAESDDEDDDGDQDMNIDDDDEDEGDGSQFKTKENKKTSRSEVKKKEMEDRQRLKVLLDDALGWCVQTLIRSESHCTGPKPPSSAPSSLPRRYLTTTLFPSTWSGTTSSSSIGPPACRAPDREPHLSPTWWMREETRWPARRPRVVWER